MKLSGFVAFAGLLLVGAITVMASVENKNPPFRNELSVNVSPDPKFDPVSTQVSSIQVVTWSGTPATLDIRRSPVLLEAYWCPHCQRTLQMLYQNRTVIDKMPDIVATGFVANTTLSEAKSLLAREETSLHFSYPKSRVYFLLNTTENSQLVQKYPQLYFKRKNAFDTMMGEHVLKAWKRALS